MKIICETCKAPACELDEMEFEMTGDMLCEDCADETRADRILELSDDSHEAIERNERLFNDLYPARGVYGHFGS